MFSVIIPLHNKEAFVSKAVQSVLDQTFSDFELIIVNDGSTDNSLSVVQRFSDPRVQIINQNNSGVSTTRNNGAEAASYRYFTFLDADDWWAPEFLHEMHELITKYPNAGLWSSKYFKFKNGKKIEANVGLKTNFHTGYINYFEVYLKTMWMPIHTSCVIVEKDVFNVVDGFNQELKMGEDFDFWARVFLKYKFAYINKALTYYNQDVDLSNRAVVSSKIWLPGHHYIFQLDYLSQYESNNRVLKKLLDNLRVRALLKYYLKQAYPNETKKEIKKIDFKNVSLYYQIIYKAPKSLVRLYFQAKKLGSRAKRTIRNF